jgi:DNA/RNA-binding domain of Phe-tRNA-synthetase-like protein
MIDLDVRIDERVEALAPGVRLGLLSGRVVVAERSTALEIEISERVRVLAELVANRPVAELPEVAAVRRAFKAFGKDPSRYRGSPEALLRRIVRGKGLSSVNTVVDAINLASLQTLLPFGLYDARFVTPPVTFRRGRAGESYGGIAKGDINLEGLPVLADASGPFGNPSSDSARAMIRSDSSQIVLVVFAFPGAGEPFEALDAAVRALTTHAGLRDARTSVVSAE